MKNHISKKQLREFGVLIGLCFPLIIGLLIPILFGHNFRFWTLYIGIPTFILGIIKPSYLLYLYKGWMSLGHILGWINSRLILGLIFIFILQPIAYLMRIFGYDPLRVKINKNKSYREIKKNNPIDLTRIF